MYSHWYYKTTRNNCCFCWITQLAKSWRCLIFFAFFQPPSAIPRLQWSGPDSQDPWHCGHTRTRSSEQTQKVRLMIITSVTITLFGKLTAFVKMVGGFTKYMLDESWMAVVYCSWFECLEWCGNSLGISVLCNCLWEVHSKSCIKPFKFSKEMNLFMMKL